MSRFTDTLLTTARRSDRGMVTGEPQQPHRRTWAQVHTRARRVAAALAARGLGRGGAVAVLAARPAEIAPAVQGAWLAGGSVTMLHQPTARTDLAEWVQDTVRVLKMIGAEAVLLGADFRQLAPVLAEHGIAQYPLDALLEAADPPDGFEPVAVGEHDTALLQLTSGTTAGPKAVRITHGNLFANITAIAEHGRLEPDRDVMVSWLPLFHDMGMVAFLTLPMLLGLELVKVTPVDFLTDPLLWPTLLSKYGGTITGAPNFAYAVIRKRLAKVTDPAAFDLSPLRIALNGAEPIDDSAVHGFTEAGARFGLDAGCVLAAYGMAEATLAVTAEALSRGLTVDTVDPKVLDADNRAVPAEPGASARHFSRLGRPLPGFEVTAVDTDGTSLGDRRVGELLIRGEAVTPGYLTEDGPLPATDENGWLHTGDIGYLADGEVVICGRLKDVIILGGRNVYPTDIERLVDSVDGIRAGNTAAVRIDADGRREGFAVVAESPLAGDPEAAGELAQRVTTRLSRAMEIRPATVHLIPPGTLPKTPSGKVRRAEAATYLARREERT
ncbi:fatty acyl-AMP ligase [Streptomyces paludis]|uniref:Long-chain fatty acid--CoA ligase n=1 Tax=Streptomyces paludis TaxID=2282738 RepID=A0A345HT45_9ACTN|nr:fatty acyl-AMP ligase [Streptomyces paludis]AXG79869.1 long-chain fatty acid--CoA ligase [Streptomyces paludis]